jgi:hypothetical protein
MLFSCYYEDITSPRGAAVRRYIRALYTHMTFLHVCELLLRLTFGHIEQRAIEIVLTSNHKLAMKDFISKERTTLRKLIL